MTINTYEEFIAALQAAGLPEVFAGTWIPGVQTQATFVRSLSEDEWETYLDVVYPERITQRAEAAGDKVQLKEEYQATIAELDQIINATTPTNAQVIAAVAWQMIVMYLDAA